MPEKHDTVAPAEGSSAAEVACHRSVAGRSTALWVISILLAVIATAVVVRRDEVGVLKAVLAQAPAGGAMPAGERGVYAFTGPLTAKTYGLFMMDVDAGTIWCYQIQTGPTGEPQLKLVAARSWIFDRFLEEFNVAEPIPAAVRALVQQQRSGLRGGAGGTQPASP